MTRRTALAILLFILGALTPLAYASPPDQTWVPGFYDTADFDDVVQQVTSRDAGPATDLVAIAHWLLPPAGRWWSTAASGAAVSHPAAPLSIPCPRAMPEQDAEHSQPIPGAYRSKGPAM